MRAVGISLFILFFLSPTKQSFALPIISPRSIESLGFTYSQFGYFVESSIPWIDYDGIREDYWPLTKVSDSDIDQLVLSDFSVVTVRQLLLRKYLITDFEPLPKKK
jgi:hypothetical protein